MTMLSPCPVLLLELQFPAPLPSILVHLDNLQMHTTSFRLMTTHLLPLSRQSYPLPNPLRVDLPQEKETDVHL